MMKKTKVIIFLYNRFFDALIQSNFWLYIKDYLENDNQLYDFVLITYEDKQHPLSQEQWKLFEEWKNKGLQWYQLTWHPGTGITNKITDIWNGFKAVSKWRLKGYKHIVSLASVAGSYAYLYSIPLGLRQFLYQFEPHSEYAIDNKMWMPKSLQYKIAHYLERKAAHKAVVIASGTRYMAERLREEWKVKGQFLKIPTVANDKKFLHNPEDRRKTRDKLGFQKDKWVLYYPGKFGDLYYREELPIIYKRLSELEPRLHLLVVTPQKYEEVKGLFEKVGVSADRYTITHSKYEDIHEYHAAADFAIISVPPGPSKKFISNIKVGEYLCAGLPFLITRGVSEDYWYAENKNVGVVVNDFTEADIEQAWPQIKYYLEMDDIQRRTHCRVVGLEYRGFESLNPIFKNAMKILTSK